MTPKTARQSVKFNNKDEFYYSNGERKFKEYDRDVEIIVDRSDQYSLSNQSSVKVKDINQILETEESRTYMPQH